MQAILHHYELSPFSEKIRLVFGLKALAWQSVLIPATLPKSDYLALTGGYRRTPSLQIGADVYCDSRLIVEELERRRPAPSLFPGGAAGLHRVLECWAEASLFWPCALAVTGANVDALPSAFHADRAAMRSRPPPAPDRVRAVGAAARTDIALQLPWLEDMLADGRAWLLGAAPGLADLAAYHALWFLEQLPCRLLATFGPSTRLLAWYARVSDLGHGMRSELDADTALEIARDAQPVALVHDEQAPFARGMRVQIEPVERTSAPVTGSVAACHAGRIAVDRDDPRAGRVRVHFPLLGYRVTEARAGPA